MLQQYTRELAEHNRELAEHNRELKIVKDNLVELDAAAEELQALSQGDSERQAAIRKNKLDQKKQENRRAELQSAIARSEAAIARSEAAIIDLRAILADLRANQKDARRDLVAKRQIIYDQLKRLDNREKRIREQMEKAAAQTGQLSFPVTRTTLWYHHSVGLTCAPEICLVASCADAPRTWRDFDEFDPTHSLTSGLTTVSWFLLPHAKLQTTPPAFPPLLSFLNPPPFFFVGLFVWFMPFDCPCRYLARLLASSHAKYPWLL